MKNEPTLPTSELSDVAEPNRGVGGNFPPGPIAYDEAAHRELADITQNFIAASDVWTQTSLDRARAQQLADQISGLRKLHTRVEKQRVKDKKPHDDLSTAVQAAYKPLLDKIDLATKKLKAHLGKYIEKKEQEVAAEKERKATAARKAEEDARLAAMQAEDSIDAQAEAEAAEKRAAEAQVEAARAAKQTVKVQSASGGGRTVSNRKRKIIEITNIRHIFMHYQDRPEVRETLERLANAEVNSKGFPDDGKIPGASIHIKTITA